MCPDHCLSKSGDQAEVVWTKDIADPSLGISSEADVLDMSGQLADLRMSMARAVTRIAALEETVFHKQPCDMEEQAVVRAVVQAACDSYNTSSDDVDTRKAEGSRPQQASALPLSANAIKVSLVDVDVASQALVKGDVEPDTAWNKVEAYMEAQISQLEAEYSKIFEAAAHDFTLLAKVVNLDYKELKIMVTRENFAEIAHVHTFTEACQEMIQDSLETACSYSLQETVWDASLLIGMPLGLGRADTAMLAVALSVQAVIQGMFCIIVIALAKENETRLYKYRGACAEVDGFDQSEFDMFVENNLGPILSCLTVLIWALCVLKDLSHISDFVVAMWSLPRAKNSSYSVHPSTRRIGIDNISFVRLGLMTFSSVIQATIASTLLLVGAMWLASTVTIMDLLLNGVALNFVLEIDELVYHVFCSAKVKTVTTHLQPLRLPRKLVQPFRVPVRAVINLAAWVSLFLIIFRLFLIPNFEEISYVAESCAPAVGQK